MKNKSIILIVLLFLILGMSFFVYGSGGGKTRIIMKIPNKTLINSKALTSFSYSNPLKNIDVKRRVGDLVSLEVNKAQITRLKEQGYKFLGPDLEVHAFLQDSVKIINATGAWSKEVSNESLNGSHVSVCIIDTGVDSNHSDLKEKVLAQKCFCSYSEGINTNCCYGNLSESKNATDNNGHGTHVAGIVAASGGIDGIAKGANIVAVKVLNSNGTGSSLDVAAAIKWCSNDTQVNAYNISVISLSLGGGQYASPQECLSSDSAGINDVINIANSKNISVVVATGNINPDNVTADAGISSPACLPNVTKVSATNKSDIVAYYAFRNINFSDILLAPGSDINSTEFPNAPICSEGGVSCQGNYAQMSGTSMATPMVSGAIAILDQYFKLSNQTKTPSEIENILNDTGKPIYDSLSGGTYSRINVYDALLSVDNVPPNVTLISPTDNNINLTSNQTFICNATDWQLANISLDIWNSSGELYNSTTQNLTGTGNQSSFEVANMSDGTYSWNCLATDKQGNSAFASANFSLTIGGVSVNLSSPPDDTYTNINETNFSCSIKSEENYNLTNVTFYLWNSTGNLNFSDTKNISGTSNSSTFNYTFLTEENYSWNCLGMNNGTNSSWGGSNFSVIYDISPPAISGIGVSGISTGGATIVWTTNESANSSISVSGGSWTNKSDYVKNHSIKISGLGASTTYNYNVTSCDRAENCNSSMGQSFTTSAAAVVSSGGGGGGGGSSRAVSVPKIYKITTEEISAGYTQSLKKNEKLNFIIFNFKGGEHSLDVKKVGVGYVNIIIRSNPINLMLGIGQSAKLNLTSPIYYDLFIRLDAIVGDKAKLTIQLIDEPIKIKVMKIVTEKKVVKKIPVVVKKDYSPDAVFLIMVLILIIGIAVKVNRKRLKRRRTLKKKEYGKRKKIKT